MASPRVVESYSLWGAENIGAGSRGHRLGEMGLRGKLHLVMGRIDLLWPY